MKKKSYELLKNTSGPISIKTTDRNPNNHNCLLSTATIPFIPTPFQALDITAHVNCSVTMSEVVALLQVRQ